MDEVIAGGEMKSLFMPLSLSLSLSLLSFFISAFLSLCVSNFSVLMRGDIMNADAVGDALKRKVTRTLAHKRSHTHTHMLIWFTPNSRQYCKNHYGWVEWPTSCILVCVDHNVQFFSWKINVHMVNILHSHLVMVFLDKPVNEILYKLKALHVFFTFYLEDTQQKISLASVQSQIHFI